ncbi:hypothetical protein MASR2M48_11560 [Spirochaetota bacterium]
MDTRGNSEFFLGESAGFTFLAYRLPDSFHDIRMPGYFDRFQLFPLYRCRDKSYRAVFLELDLLDVKSEAEPGAGNRRCVVVAVFYRAY